MHYNSFFKHILFVCILVLLGSCDKDFNEIGSDIIGEDHFGLEQISRTASASTYDMGPVQTNNLPINALGIYNNPVFGITKAHFVTQLEFPNSGVNPTIDPELVPEIESVTLTVPYFSEKINTDAAGVGTYELDSIYGPSVDNKNNIPTSKIKLSVYENGYYLRDLDPIGGFLNDQKYYSDQNADFFSTKGALLNDDSHPGQNNEFGFSASENEVTTVVDGVSTTTKTAPGMVLNLNKDFFKTKIFEAPAGKLLSNNIFKEWFRGLYFHVENSGSHEGNLAMLNFKLGKITIKYKQYKTKPVTGQALPEKEDKTILLNLTGNSVNLLEYSNSVTQVADRLYLKGGAGSLAVIDLFGADADADGVADQLEQLRADKWLINEANLTFTIDKSTMNLAAEPKRIYLYDLDNKRPLLDYYVDFSTNADSKYNKFVHNGIIQTDETTDKRGTKYKIRVTNHIRNLIHKDSSNVRLGLVVTEDITEIRTAKVKNPFTAGGSTISQVPVSSVMSPLGTILYGSDGSGTEEQRLKLEIYYTKPN